MKITNWWGVGFHVYLIIVAAAAAISESRSERKEDDRG